MGRRKKEASQMGKALIKDRFKGKKTVRGGESFLHTTEMDERPNQWGPNLALNSVTEQTSLDDFLTTAELAGRDFTAERENVQIVSNNGTGQSLPPTKERLQKIKAAQDLYKSMLRIPRRPPWTSSTTADKLKEDEHISFLEWRRLLGKLKEEEDIVITPYEKNLEFWRQLWRVIERSDVVVQIVDARNPLLFWAPDLDKYVKEVDARKQTVLLINKADYLTLAQREAWVKYFTEKKVNVVFWSAKEEAERLEAERAELASQLENASINDPSTDDEDSDDIVEDDNESDRFEENECGEQIIESSGADEEHVSNSDSIASDPTDFGGVQKSNSQEASDSRKSEEGKDGEILKKSVSGVKTALTATADNKNEEYDEDDSDGFETEEEYTDTEGGEDDSEDETVGDTVSRKAASVPDCTQDVQPSTSKLHSSNELLSLFRSRAKMNFMEGVTTVGMVGYPNVGKSSTINTILQTKKVSVSATPGHTKHFQTLYVEKDLMLCDCPGLVFPSFVNSKADLVVNGILPIDQLMDSDSPITIVCERMGRKAFEGTYHINLPPPEEWEDPDTPPTAYDLLHTYGLLHGFMSHKGNPDRPRSARHILKDYVNGKLLFCHPPPGIDPAAFQKPPYAEPKVYKCVIKPSTKKTVSERKTEAIEREFFAKRNSRAHAIGPKSVRNYLRTEACKQIGQGEGDGQGQASGSSTPYGSQASLVGKPWKKHNNRNKKEKLRRVYKEHDYVYT